MADGTPIQYGVTVELLSVFEEIKKDPASAKRIVDDLSVDPIIPMLRKLNHPLIDKAIKERTVYVNKWAVHRFDILK